MKNPIYAEYYTYYPHEGCLCYKIKNPWSAYGMHTFVLCPVSDGLDKAKDLARKYIILALEEKMNLPVEGL
jgi:hypothetical protein